MDQVRKKIVVIDDEPSFKEIMETALKQEGFEVSGFTDPREALRAITGEHPDLILLDILMPDINGFSVLGFLFKDLKDHPPKIVFISNLKEMPDGRKIDEQFIKSLGAQGYIEKTGDIKEMVAEAKKFLNE